ncbi:MAG: hypothetical protein KGN32_11825 [Burkholderiales bacterium]|nr:hypothetical protein [Burkholderiales bacterium]
MERFDSSNSELVTHASFEEAIASAQGNLARNVSDASKVYEIIMHNRKIAVFRVDTNSANSGEGWWFNKIKGKEDVVALPYDLFNLDNKVYSLHARYRIALA